MIRRLWDLAVYGFVRWLTRADGIAARWAWQ